MERVEKLAIHMGAVPWKRVVAQVCKISITGHSSRNVEKREKANGC